MSNPTGIGGFQKGVSGNPAGRPKGALSPVVLLAREHTAAAIQTLAEIACKGKNENARITAAVALLDRAYGRPAQSVEMDLKLTKNLEQMTLQELQELRERYAALALASPALVIDHDSTEAARGRAYRRAGRCLIRSLTRSSLASTRR